MLPFLVSVPKDRRVVAAIVLAAVLAALLVVVAIAQGIGNPSVPSGAVALVEDAPDGEISTEEFDRALKQAARQQQVAKVPAPSDPQYAALRDAAMSDLLLGRWLRGEASERGITVSDSEVTNRLEEFIEQDFGGQKGFERYLEQAAFTAEEARSRVELVLLGDQLQTAVVPDGASVSDTEIEDFYNANQAQFEQPETLDVRRIVNKDQAQVEEAKALLEQDDSPANWKKVASRFSTEDATKDEGGLIEGVTIGQSEPVLEEQLFAADQGELVGPFKGQTDYYLIQVVKVIPAQTTPIAEVSEQIKQQLVQGKEQETVQRFQVDFTEKWTSRTFCADGYVVNQCENFTPPVQPIPGAAPVTPLAVVSPGRTAVFPGQPIPGLPQRPCAFQDLSLDPPEICDWPSAPGAQPGVIGPEGAPLPPGGAPAPVPAPPPGG
jgi:foldase protein PrsA